MPISATPKMEPERFILPTRPPILLRIPGTLVMEQPPLLPLHHTHTPI